MRKFVFNIENEYSGFSAGDYLKKHMGFSRGLITSLKYEGGINLNGKSVFVTEKVHEGDVLEVVLKDGGAGNIVPANMKLDIIFEDEDILCVNKPSFMATHPSLNHYDDTLANGVCGYYKDTDFTFRPVNRLDKNTSGTVIIAKNRYSCEALASQIRQRKIKKVYIAVADGVLKDGRGIIEAPIAREKEGIIKRCISENGQWAKTEYELIRAGKDRSLVRLFPVTGRTHQLRVHMAYIGHSIAGDFLYGKEDAPRLMLHCESIEFCHPVTGEKIKAVSLLPPDFTV